MVARSSAPRTALCRAPSRQRGSPSFCWFLRSYIGGCADGDACGDVTGLLCVCAVSCRVEDRGVDPPPSSQSAIDGRAADGIEPSPSPTEHPAGGGSAWRPGPAGPHPALSTGLPTRPTRAAPWRITVSTSSRSRAAVTERVAPGAHSTPRDVLDVRSSPFRQAGTRPTTYLLGRAITRHLSLEGSDGSSACGGRPSLRTRVDRKWDILTWPHEACAPPGHFPRTTRSTRGGRFGHGAEDACRPCGPCRSHASPVFRPPDGSALTPHRWHPP